MLGCGAGRRFIEKDSSGQETTHSGADHGSGEGGHSVNLRACQYGCYGLLWGQAEVTSGFVDTDLENNNPGVA